MQYPCGRPDPTHNLRVASHCGTDGWLTRVLLDLYNQEKGAVSSPSFQIWGLRPIAHGLRGRLVLFEEGFATSLLQVQTNGPSVFSQGNLSFFVRLTVYQRKNNIQIFWGLSTTGSELIIVPGRPQSIAHRSWQINALVFHLPEQPD